MTIAGTLLWSYNELTDEINRTATLISTEITAEDAPMQFYSLSYTVQHEEYNLTTRASSMDFSVFHSTMRRTSY